MIGYSKKSLWINFGLATVPQNYPSNVLSALDQALCEKTKFYFVYAELHSLSRILLSLRAHKYTPGFEPNKFARKLDAIHLRHWEKL